jgi:3-isopropylmalate/(R)-2-methylmalate dehydratase small subunit
MQATCGDRTVAITMPEGARQSFIEGLWDSCGQLVDRAAAVRETASNLPYLSWA